MVNERQPIVGRRLLDVVLDPGAPLGVLALLIDLRVARGHALRAELGHRHFGKVDRKCSAFEPIAFCPGYLRGLAFVDRFALVGLSRPRGDNKTFAGLDLGETLAAKGASARCALVVIDLRSGDIVHWLHIEGVVEELYDVVILPGVVRPMAIGFKSDEIRRLITLGRS